MYKNVMLFEQWRYIPLLQWPDEWHGRFFSMDVKTLLVLDTSAQVITVKNPTMLHPGVRLVLFIFGKIGKDDMVQYCLVSLVCADVTTWRHKMKAYGRA